MKNDGAKKETVFVALSGGVDSSVTAVRLLREGYDVVGVFIKVWHPEWLTCNWEAERLDAMRVAAHLRIPFLTCDAVDAYKKDVADYFIAEYIAGRTPNPDVLCNQFVKFGRLLEFADSHGIKKIATGHYARVQERDGNFELLRGVDTAKDQSYFLWTLSQNQLARTLFPVGDTPKDKIREEAEAAGLPTAVKKDSQGVCFLGHIDIPEFLSHYTELVPGPVLNKNGERVGEHVGALVYTLGQRHGFTITTASSERSKYYVIEKNVKTNTLVVDTETPELSQVDTATLCEIVLRKKITVGDVLQMQSRYRQTPFEVEVTEVFERSIVFMPKEKTDMPASGQSCVLYDGDLCLGGGIMT